MALLRQVRRAELVALALVGVSLTLLALPDARQRAISRTANEILLYPLARVRSALEGHRDLRVENTRLREALQQARLVAAAAEADRRQSRELQRMLGFRDGQSLRLVPARIVDRNFSALPTSVVLDVGLERGVRQNLPVVNDEGLVGKTVAVGRGLTRVMLYSHPDFSASALLVGGDHLEYGIVRPSPDGMLRLHLPLRSESAPGDRIVTSGYGGTFPRGIPIGEVAAVEEDQRLGLQRIDRVAPVVDLGRLGVAFVMLREPAVGRSAGDEPGLFWPGYASPPMVGERFAEPDLPDSLRADSMHPDSLAGVEVGDDAATSAETGADRPR